MRSFFMRGFFGIRSDVQWFRMFDKADSFFSFLLQILSGILSGIDNTKSWIPRRILGGIREFREAFKYCNNNMYIFGR